jgi:hypothetical protein
MSYFLSSNYSNLKKVTSLPEHSYIRPLGHNDVDQILKLETAGFPEEERASKEKVC